MIDKQTQYIIAYVTDNGDLYTEECENYGLVQIWLDENDTYKAVVLEVVSIEGEIFVKTHWHT